MKRNYKLKNLGCANCAAKMERQIGALEHVDACTIAFMTTKMTIEAADECMESVVEQAKTIISGIEPEVELVRV